jgi:transcriptional regulator with XRE-family HTH domain
VETAPLGSRIRELRTVRGLTLTALADEAGLPTGLISQVERGLSDPSLETLRRIAKVLDVLIFSLFQQDADTTSSTAGSRPAAAAPRSCTAGSARTRPRRPSPGRTRPRSACWCCPAR